mmetsp:Transcript_26444/g.54775  ORF Transcript_26444/g.54775 Transcript_26444/m.54775 type:complete len:173 (+) Transcript_26444:250-768(+)
MKRTDNSCQLPEQHRRLQAGRSKSSASNKSPSDPSTNRNCRLYGPTYSEWKKIGNYVSEKENVNEDILRLGKEGSPFCVEVDLMMPVDETKSPKVHVPPLNHIGLWIDDLPAAVAWMETQGVRFTPGGIRKGASGHDVTFIHPKGNESSPIGGGGVLIELVQAPKEVVDVMS